MGWEYSFWLYSRAFWGKGRGRGRIKIDKKKTKVKVFMSSIAMVEIYRRAGEAQYG